jgi:tight adherence protein B
VVAIVTAVLATRHSARRRLGTLASPDPGRSPASTRRPEARRLVAGVTGGVCLVGLALGVGTAAVVACLVAVGVIARDRARKAAEATAYEQQLPDALETVARAVRTGDSLQRALARAGASARQERSGVGGRPRPETAGTGPVADLAEVADVTGRGVPLVDALDGWMARRPTESVRLAGSGLSLAAELGGESAHVVDRLADTLRERQSWRREARAMAAQARLSALVVTISPIAFTAILAIFDPRSIRFLTSSPAGLVCLVVGAGLDAFAYWWMRRLVDGVAR